MYYKIVSKKYRFNNIKILKIEIKIGIYIFYIIHYSVNIIQLLHKVFFLE